MQPLGDLQLAVMEIVWELGKATVADVHKALSAKREIAYTTVLTTMRALERRGMLHHDILGKAFVYYPGVDRESYNSRQVDKLVGDLFQGSPRMLLSHLLGTRRISQQDIDEAEELIRQSQEKKR